jgi:hypothetical protein
MLYADWKQKQIEANQFTSFDRYRDEFPEVKEYQCFYLNPDFKLAHDDDAEVLFETDNLAEACTFVYNKFKQEKRDIAVYQPRSQGYREHYQNKLRDRKGRFVKA